MEIRAIIELKVEKRFLEAIYKALKPETATPPTERSKASIRINNNEDKIIIEIYSRDFTSIRAAMNSYIRWIKSIIDTINVVKQNELV